eukprot:XP_001697430.1 predicted protein [Chlamydomonas reinhardtii]
MEMALEWAGSSAVQAHAVLALSGLTSLYITIARPTIRLAADGSHTCPPASLWEAGTSPALSSVAMCVFRFVMAVYIFGMGGMQFQRMGAYVFKFYTIWNWWLLGIYFTLAATASALCALAETRSARARAATAKPTVTAAAEVDNSNGSAALDASRSAVGNVAKSAPETPKSLQRATLLSRTCHALFMINSRRLLLTFTSYNQHGLNALYIFTDLFLNRHRLAFHATGPLGLWSMAYAVWAHVWHAKSGKWLYPFLDTSKPWAPMAYFGLYMVHWGAFGLVALLYRAKARLYSSNGKPLAAAAADAARGKGKTD